METSFASKSAMNLVGVSARTTNLRETGPDGAIPQLWNDFFAANLSGIDGVSEPHLTYVLYTDYESDVNGVYTVLIGHAWAKEAAPEGLAVEAVPQARYVVFKSERGPVARVVTEAWQRIWAWFETSSYERAYTGDFEVYDARGFDPGDAEVEIYVAVREA